MLNLLRCFFVALVTCVLVVGSYKAITVPTFKSKDKILKSLLENVIRPLYFALIILAMKLNALYSRTVNPFCFIGIF